MAIFWKLPQEVHLTFNSKGMVVLARRFRFRFSHSLLAPHTLTDREEKILADVRPLASSPSDIFNILSNTDFRYPGITLSNGRKVELNQAGFLEIRALPSRAEREKAMSAFFNALGSFSRTYGATMNASVQKSLFFAKARNYSGHGRARQSFTLLRLGTSVRCGWAG